jgi:hypothetical protein
MSASSHILSRTPYILFENLGIAYRVAQKEGVIKGKMSVWPRDRQTGLVTLIRLWKFFPNHFPPRDELME